MNEKEIMTCAICGQAIEEGTEFAVVDEETICIECLDSSNKYFYCEDCEEWYSKDSVEEYTTSRGKVICENCTDSYNFCIECEEFFEDDDGQYVGDNWVCDHCLENSSRYFYCEDCETWYEKRTQNYYEVEENRYVCDSCYDDYERCTECDVAYRRDDMHYIESEDEYLCDDCFRNSKKVAIKNYSYKPEPKFKTMAHDEFLASKDIRELLFGLELEVDSGDYPEEMATKLVEISEDIYCKHDGSLGRNGVEIVTHPCVLEYHMKELGWDKIIKIAREYNYLGHDSGRCGLHIHVGIDQLGQKYEDQDLAIANLIVLVNKHWKKLTKFSRRRTSQLNQWAKIPYVDLTNSIERIRRDAINTRRDGRYQAVNLENRTTIEFRLFNSTLKLETLLATIKLVDNFCKYAMQHTTEEAIKSKWLDVALYEEDKTLRNYLELRKILENDNEEHENIEIKEDEERELYPEGTRVIVVNPDVNVGHIDDVESLIDLVGELATIVTTDTSNDHEYGIRFDRYHSDLHSLNGRTDPGHGYYVYPENIARIGEQVIAEARDTYTEF